ncbi:MAG TPA: DUF1835 domain-containing protein [Steroidobacteraceae bacterium]|nr:DUF1835 domain-containing protein [Steroidobacteraceae bacterium]
MTDRTERPLSAFRINIEQQKNRAKDLLRAVKAGDDAARQRIATTRPSCNEPDASIKLADAQLTIARELRFRNWAALKSHVEAMDKQRVALDRRDSLDANLKTLHIRCGSDIRQTLQEGGFAGDFLEHSIPYCAGPVAMGPDRHQLMARFLVDAFPTARGGLVYERELKSLEASEEKLDRSASDYQRVVLWMEHDSWDQLVLVRVLAHYAQSARPLMLELIAINEFPGGERFIGLGQLPAEALRLLWAQRKPVTTEQLILGRDAWTALAAKTPVALAKLAKTGTPALPLLSPAIYRHLRELPSTKNGLTLTEQLVLEIVADRGATLNEVFHLMKTDREPLPWLGDLGLLHIVENMLRVIDPVLERSPSPPNAPFARQLTITDAGRAVLIGTRDWQSFAPPLRWVGGVQIDAQRPGWRWSESSRDVVMI